MLKLLKLKVNNGTTMVCRNDLLNFLEHSSNRAMYEIELESLCHKALSTG
jgi:hypothetical protein